MAIALTMRHPAVLRPEVGKLQGKALKKRARWLVIVYGWPPRAQARVNLLAIGVVNIV